MALAAVAGGLLGCSDALPPAPTPRHIVLVTIDTLRADHVGAYGGAVATPNLDRIAIEGALVERASAHVPLTRPSHVTLFSGRLPFETGVRDNLSPSRLDTVPLLAEILSENGFRSAAFVSSIVVGRHTGLDRGFEHYDDELGGAADGAPFLDRAQRRGDRTLERAVAWLEGNRQSPHLLMWLHLYDPHDPYEPPEPYATRYADRPYAGEVAWSDALIGRLDDALARLDLRDDTLLVVTSDHGEGLGDHDETLHGFFVYESTLHVPLLVRGPGVEPGARLRELVGLADLFPTLLDLVGLPTAAQSTRSARSFGAALRGEREPPAEPLYAETLVPQLQFGWSDLRALRSGRFKLIQAPRPELYDLESDPGERHNLIERETSRAADLQAALSGLLAGELEPAAAPMPDLPAEVMEGLAALGYLGSRANGPESALGKPADPKDKLEEFRLANDLMRSALARLHEGRFEESAAGFERMLEHGIDNGDLRVYLGRALLGDGQPQAASRHFAEAARQLPGRATAWLGWAESLLQLDDFAGALDVLRRGRAALPERAELLTEEGQILRGLGRHTEARRVLEAALALDPEAGRGHALLGEVLRELGDREALQHLERAVELSPGVASYWNAFGMNLAGSGDLEAAESAFRNAVRLDGRHHLYAYNLGLALQRLGRADEARPHFERALELRPDFLPARERLNELAR